jgi:predicted nuclease of predicted toxin-antitoxin system
MNSGKKLLLLWMLCPILASSVGTSYGKDIQLTDKDKAQIIESILLDTDFLNRGLRVGERKEVVYLSTENISPELVPEVRGINFVLLSPEEVEEKSKTGLRFYAFGEFKVKGSKVLVSFGDTWRNDNWRAMSYRTTRYEYRRVSGRWRGKEVSVSMGMS